MKMSVKEIENVVKEVLGRGCGWVWRDEYKVKSGKRVRLKWWGLMVSDEEIEKLKMRLGDKFYVGRNIGGGYDRFGWKNEGGDLVVRVMRDDLRIRKYVMRK